MPVRSAIKHIFCLIWQRRRESSTRFPNDTLYGHVKTLNTAAGSTRAAAAVLPLPLSRIKTVVSGALCY